MTFRDDSAHAPDEQHALVGGDRHPGDALMVQSNGAPAPYLTVPGASRRRPSTTCSAAAWMRTRFLHALRRRWLLALCMGLVIGGASAISLWYLFPESSSATALFQVANEEDSLIFNSTPKTLASFEVLKKTQLALLKSNFVLTAAIRPAGIASLSVLAGEPDPVEWLQENLVVDFPQNGEILSITLSGEDEFSEDLRTLVNAVAKAYNDEVIEKDSTRRSGNHDLLAAQSRKLERRHQA